MPASAQSRERGTAKAPLVRPPNGPSEPIRGAANPTESLKASELFRTLSDAERAAIIAAASIKRVPRDAVIVRRGEPGTSMIVILSGRARVTLFSAEGREVTLAVLGPGEIIGEIAMLTGGARSADVNAIEDCELLIASRSHFLELLRGNFDLCLRLLNIMCARIRRATASLEEIALLDLSGRLGRVLLRLAETHGRRTAQGIQIELRLSQKDLGALVAASRERVNRQMRRWRAEGVVTWDRRFTQLLKPEALLAEQLE